MSSHQRAKASIVSPCSKSLKHANAKQWVDPSQHEIMPEPGKQLDGIKVTH
jgi:hypothetical protein